MGRNNDEEDALFASTVLTSPCFPWITLTIRPKCHFPPGRSWSTTITRFPTCTFRRGLCHFCFSCRAGTYSLSHRLQKWSANICVCLHFFLNCISSFTKVPGGKALTALCNNSWFGVNGWRSLGSSETAQRGLEWRVVSTSVRTVASTSSSTRLSPNIAFKAARVLWISLSHTPLAWEASGGWNTHWYPLCRSSSLIWHWFQLSIACLMSRSAPTKLVPLSGYIHLGGPLLFTNLLKTLITQSDSGEMASSKCIALEFMHVNIAPHLLITDLPFLIKHLEGQSSPFLYTWSTAHRLWCEMLVRRTSSVPWLPLSVFFAYHARPHNLTYGRPPNRYSKPLPQVRKDVILYSM